MPGTDNSVPELTHVSRHGLWLLFDNEELFLPFEAFPRFRRATIEQLSVVERPTNNHLYWPQLDVDLAVQSVRDPAAYPLESRELGKNDASKNVPLEGLLPQPGR